MRECESAHEVLLSRSRTFALSHCMDETLAFLRERITRAPSAIVVLGSGLGGLAEEILDPVTIGYDEIPGFPDSTVLGHAGCLVAGILNGVEVVAMQGRFHLYEGWEPEAVALPIRALAALGAGVLVLSNAAGGLRPGFRAGDLMLIADHMNLMGKNPLIGPVLSGEERFPDMSAPYDTEFRKIAAEVALQAKIPLEEGVYAAVLGPSYETPAEIRMLRLLGADAVGMSTVPEVIVARHGGLRVLGISMISNIATPDAPPANHEEVLAAGESVKPKFAALILDILARMQPHHP